MTVLVPLLFSIVVANTNLLATNGPKSVAPCAWRAENGSQLNGITTDDDGRIWFTKLQNDGARYERQLGTLATAEAPKAEEMAVIPSGEFVVARRQFTCKRNGWSVVVLLTIASSLSNGRPFYTNTIRVIRSEHSNQRLILTKRYPTVNKMTLDDINGDGSPELGVQWTDGSLISPSTWVDLWIINGDGTLSAIDLSNVVNELDAPFASHGSSVEWGLPAADNFVLISEQRIVKSSTSSERIRKVYKWDKEAHRYKFSRKIVAEERIVK